MKSLQKKKSSPNAVVNDERVALFDKKVYHFKKSISYVCTQFFIAQFF